MTASTLKTQFQDIRIIILIAFVVRLYGITMPPLEVAHNWRQTTVTMVARNFVETDFNVLYPRIDFAGNKTGITGMEFPLLNANIALCIKTFGSSHWYGRLINLIVSSIGLWCFYQLVLHYSNKKHAFYSTIILMCSIWFAYSRKIMPDTFSASLALAALYFLTTLFKRINIASLVGFVILTALALLSKLPSCIVLVWAIPAIYFSRLNPNKKALLFVAFAAACLPAIWWYFIWVPHLVSTFGFWHFFMGTTWQQGIAEIAANKMLTASRFFDSALKYSGFVIFIWGCCSIILQKQKVLLTALLFSLSATCLLILKSGFTFAHHSYYIIPFVPAMALVAGYGLASLKNKKIAATLLIIICAEGILNQYHDFKIKPNEAAMLSLDRDMNSVTKKDDLIMINSGDNPTPMYFAHRKGWIAHNYQIADSNYLKSCRTQGLKQLLILHRTFGTTITLPLPIIFTNENYTIYSID